VVIESFSGDALVGKHLGLFGVTQGAVIEDLSVTMNSPDINLNVDEDQYIAGLAGRLREGTVKNVTVTGTLRVAKTGSRSLALGGLAALVSAASIEGSASSMTIQGTIGAEGFAGGIVAKAEGRTVISGSSALGDVSLTGPASGSAAYAGGVVGYAETIGGSAGTALKLSGVNYTEGRVSVTAYGAYSGGVAGYTKGAEIYESFSSGTVSAQGSSPFAGGIAAFLGGGMVKNVYSAAEVRAVSVTRRALAGGIAGGVSEGAEISAAYTTAQVRAEGTGSLAGLTSTAPNAVRAGGIAGALYNGGSAVKNSAVLEGSSAAAADLVIGNQADPKAYRVAGKGTEGADTAVALASNLAYAGMSLSSRSADDKGSSGQDGEDCAGKPDQAAFSGMGWDFAGVWKMGRGGLPVLAGQPVNIGDYITISSGADLAQIGNNNGYPLNGEYRIAAGSSDITLSEWKPIGTAEKPFSGSLSGNGTTVIRISGFSPSAGESPGLGLFGYVKGSVRQRAELKDLKVEVTMSGSLSAKTAQYAGALAGYGEELTITGSIVSGSIGINKTSAYPLYSGGIIGYLKNGKISGSSSAVAVESEGQSGVYSGGVLGYAAGSISVSGCSASGNILTKAGAHNSSAGGVVGYILGTNDSTVSLCSASGNVSLTPASGREASQLMLYCGGVAGYAGNGTADTGGERTGAVIEKCRYTGGEVYCENAYPYVGGVIGYNYTGSVVKESFSAAGTTVKAKGSRLPYAGGVAGYISGAAQVLNSYSHATVIAEALESKQALAGGVAGATAKPSLVSKCYATGAVTAKINGAGTDDMGGSLGVPSAANAGGISGSLYYANPKVEKSVALNVSVSGIDTGSGGVRNVYRVGGKSTVKDGGTPELAENIAWSGMTVSPESVGDEGPNGQDGEDCDQKPGQSVYSGLGWDFSSVWRMGGDYPVLQWEK
jgi:hypothetical protein